MSRQSLDTTVTPKDAPTISDAEAAAAIVELAERRPDLFDRTADDGKLDRYLTALDSDDATLADVHAVVRVLARTPNIDGVRLLSACMRLSTVLSRYSAHVQTAPAEALNDVVVVVLVPCRNDLCSALIAPWDREDRNGCCSGECETAWLRTVES